MPSHRAPLLALAVTLAVSLAACAGNRPGPSAITSSPRGQPTPIAAPSTAATDEPSAHPPGSCPVEGAAAPASLELRALDGLQTIVLDLGALPSPGVTDPGVVPIVDTVLGGTPLTAQLAVEVGPVGDMTIDAISADYVPFDSATAQPVTLVVDGATVTMRLPDRDMDGQLRVALSWTSSCGSGFGAGTIGLSVLDSSVAVGCPLTADGLLASVVAMQRHRIAIGTLTVPINIVGWSGRWTEGGGADDLPRFAGWQQDAVITAAPDTTVVVKESVDDLALDSVRAVIFLRAEVLDYLEPTSDGDLSSVSVLRRTAGPKGRVGLRVPLDPGDYVIEVKGDWLTSCLVLESYAVVSLAVR